MMKKQGEGGDDGAKGEVLDTEEGEQVNGKGENLCIEEKESFSSCIQVALWTTSSSTAAAAGRSISENRKPFNHFTLDNTRK